MRRFTPRFSQGFSRRAEGAGESGLTRGIAGAFIEAMARNASPIRCLISAGPTREYFDPVRYISNPSSGKMGYALAHAALERGWRVELVSGPVALAEPPRSIVYPVVTGQDMYERVVERFLHCDILLMTAAVCDFRPKHYSEHKVKKGQAQWTIEFEPVIDILKTVAATKTHQCIVGFAAETDNVLDYARKKLREKNLDWIAANTVGKAGTGFEADHNQLTLISRDGASYTYGPDRKEAIAREMLARVAQLLEEGS